MLKGHTPFKLVYGQEVVVPLEFFSTQLMRSNYHTDDRWRRSKGKTESIIVNG
jgi:hypothetical protein